MNQELDDKLSLERTRIESFALASNQGTSPEFIKALFANKITEEEQDQGGDWVTPESADELEELLNRF